MRKATLNWQMSKNRVDKQTKLRKMGKSPCN